MVKLDGESIEPIAREYQLEVYWDAEDQVKRLRWRDEVAR